MRIRDLATAPFVPGKDRRAGNWSSSDAIQGFHYQRTIWHYSTVVLTFDPTEPQVGEPRSLWIGLGHGSVSDQQGINDLLRAAGLPFTYRRDFRGGGPRIEMVER